MNKVVVIGAGASGIVASLSASKNADIILIDGNDRCGKKILLTGNGHCNYWNSNININAFETDNQEVLSSILNYKDEVFDFLYNLGIYPKIKNEYFYPYSNQALSIREIFEREIKKSNITFKNNFKVKSIEKNNNIFIIKSTDNKIIEADKVIVATGSKAYPKTGSDGSGYELASSFGHTINKVYPSLVPLVSSSPFIKDLENTRCDAKITLMIDDKKIKEEVGELQFTKNGISGICTFNISSLVSKNLDKNVEVIINFLPNISDDLYEWFNNRDDILKNKTIEEQLESIFNYKLMFVLFKEAGVSKDSKWCELSEKEKERLINAIGNFKLKIINTESFDRCQVCTGGVSLSEIDSLTMESKIVSNLYFTGEILDVDGMCGGFNLAFAFITGYLAGRGV